jgi:hypothetical protein
MNQFNIKDINGKLIQTGYQYFADIQKNIIDKFHDNDRKIISTIGEERWNQYKNLMKEEKQLRDTEQMN